MDTINGDIGNQFVAHTHVTRTEGFAVVKNAQKPDHASLSKILSWLEEGHYVIPDFQREFEWEAKDIRELVRSIFLDYYIGSLLLMNGKRETFESLSCEPVYGQSGEGRPTSIVLDGQQRLTAMNYAFTAPDKPLPNRTGRAFFWIDVVKFMEGFYDEAFHYRWGSRNANRLFSTPELQYAEHVFPCHMVGVSSPRRRYDWFTGYERFWTNRAEELKEVDPKGAERARNFAELGAEFGDQVEDVINQYQISYIELDRDLDIAKVCDIFTQLNSKGVRLDIFDLMNALLKPKGLQLKHLWRKAEERLSFLESGRSNVYVLMVMSILAQEYCSPAYLYYLLPNQQKPIRQPDGVRRNVVLVESADDFARRWSDAVDSLEKSVTVLRHPQEYGAVASRFVPYVSILPAFASIHRRIEQLEPSLRLSAQSKFRQWYWASVFDNRYSGSVESTSTADYREMIRWFHDDSAKPQWIEDFGMRLSSLDLANQYNTGSSIYKGVFNLFVLEGARDWISGSIPPFDAVDDHHIVPQSWGNDNLPAGRVHSVLNRTPLTSETNRHVIKDRLPNRYLRDLIDENGREQVEQIMMSHLITGAAIDVLLRDPFISEDFEEFLTLRRIAILDAIQMRISDKRLDLSPALRKMDEDINHIELELRELIANVLQGDAGNLPDHVLAKVQGRIESAAAKNPIFDPSAYSSLLAMLEFADLRELQQAITSKKCWPEFEPIFQNKPQLENRFDALAETRNALRHNRSLSESQRKDGDSATTWFFDVVRRALSASSAA